MNDSTAFADLVDRLDMVLCRTSRLILPRALAVDDPAAVVARRARAIAEPPEDEGFPDLHELSDAEVVEYLFVCDLALVGQHMAGVQQEALGPWLTKTVSRVDAAGTVRLESGRYQALVALDGDVAVTLLRAADMGGDSFFNAVAVPLEPCSDEALAAHLDLPLVDDAYPTLCEWSGLLVPAQPGLGPEVLRLLREADVERSATPRARRGRFVLPEGW